MRITYRKEQNDVVFELQKKPEDESTVKELSFNNGRLVFKVVEKEDDFAILQMSIASAREEVTELVYQLLGGAIEQTFRAHAASEEAPLMDGTKAIHLPGGGIHLVGE